MTAHMNYTKLPDLYAIAKARADAIAAELGELREQILATGREVLDGDAYRVTVSLAETTRLDTKEARKLLKPAQLAQCEKTSMVTTLRVKAALLMAA